MPSNDVLTRAELAEAANIIERYARITEGQASDADEQRVIDLAGKLRRAATAPAVPGEAEERVTRFADALRVAWFGEADEFDADDTASWIAAIKRALSEAQPAPASPTGEAGVMQAMRTAETVAQAHRAALAAPGVAGDEEPAHCWSTCTRCGVEWDEANKPDGWEHVCDPAKVRPKDECFLCHRRMVPAPGEAREGERVRPETVEVAPVVSDEYMVYVRAVPNNGHGRFVELEIEGDDDNPHITLLDDEARAIADGLNAAVAWTSQFDPVRHGDGAPEQDGGRFDPAPVSSEEGGA